MPITLRQVGADEIDDLYPLLLLAEPSQSALSWSLKNLSDTVYSAEEAGQMIGAVTVRWESEPCEIVELAVDERRQGEGIGRQIIESLLSEARQRGKERMIVGTANTSIGNILFYQKCGFRMDHVRRDYFWYHREREIENGIPIRDMIVFSYDLSEGGRDRQSAT